MAIMAVKASVTASVKATDLVPPQASFSGQSYETTDEEAEYSRLMTVGWTEEQKIESDRESQQYRP